MPNNHSSLTQVVYGEKRVRDTLSQFLSRQNGVDLCSDSKTAAQLLEIYRKMSFDSNAGTGVKIRFLTDINKDNILLCKELMKLTAEVRHLEGIKANFAVRNKEYIGIADLKKEAQQGVEKDEHLTYSQSHIIYSNVNGIIEQQQ